MEKQGLYNPEFEHDNCGVGFIAEVNGIPSFKTVQDGITILKNLVHRGAVGGDINTGDGAGILTQIPAEFFAKTASSLGFSLPDQGSYGLGVMFFPTDRKKRDALLLLVHNTLEENGGKIIGQRDVPVNPDCLGETARLSMPFVVQMFVSVPGLTGDELERKLYVLRRLVEKAAALKGYTIEDLYIPSFSARTIIYKGMFVAPQLEQFYPDLQDRTFKSAIALVHQRYSTNTFPSWSLAQPFRYIAHNGEINTLRGNISKMRARESMLSSPLFGDDLKRIFPLIDSTQSDSAIFDTAFELLVQGGRSMEHTMMMMVPEPFGKRYHISEDRRTFYEYHASILEPWDGPAALVFSDGIKVGASLDRNGLRPARWLVTKDGRVILASEAGVLDIPPENILKNGRLGPGRMLMVDTGQKRIMYDHEIKSKISRRKPYRRWLDENRIELKGLFRAPDTDLEVKDDIEKLERVFGYTLEEIDKILIPMAVQGSEPISSMGNDASLAVLSDRPQLLYNYFRQVFAQVTNPPIDPYRENLVMSLMSFIGREHNLLEEGPLHCKQLKLSHPVLSNDDMLMFKKANVEGQTAAVIDILYNPEQPGRTLEESLEHICARADELIDQGNTFLILSDRGVAEEEYPIPALLAISVVNQHLVYSRRRQLAGLLVETGEVRDVMQMAALIGYGASAVNPYLAFEIIKDRMDRGKLNGLEKLDKAFENYIASLKKGLLKIMSKMGVSTIRSYKGAQIFEAVGLHPSFIEKYFPGTPTRIGGVGLKEIAASIEKRHRLVFKGQSTPFPPLDSGGTIHYRRHSEKHLMTPEVVVTIQKAVREKSYEKYREFARAINNAGKNLCTLRGLFTFRKREPVPLEEVESAEEIVKRFASSAMSMGSISKEAHETIAIAMNRLGAMSNSGEGGEDEVRFAPLPGGDLAKTFVKQVASGRFGVTINYLVNAREMQIKMAQGAKPGEGGQLPGHKVDTNIARIRHSIPGVTLISPPPHHDIYSIEDLSQLIYDLHNANPDARVSVKLVSEVGVGTIAAGVAKGKADMVLISGHDGGTGASPLSSIKYAGIPWEIGLSETQQTLVLNNLRSGIRIQTDGQLRTGRDVVIAALLGAEEFGFATISLVTMGCVLMRKCHLNTCPVGVATQNPELRKRFKGKPEYLVNYMMFVAEDVREIMASLGFRKFDDMIGQSDILEVNEAVSYWKDRGLDFSALLQKPPLPPGGSYRCTRKNMTGWEFIDGTLDSVVFKKILPVIEKKERLTLPVQIRNSNRSFGTYMSGEIVKRYGKESLDDDSLVFEVQGGAGQSFGAFLCKGMSLKLTGIANDYVGKGLSGGKIIITPPPGTTFRPENNILIGNVALFGATEGVLLVNGMAGERFAVRNSGATAVVEGVGDHGCEYMTGGVVVVLGRTGLNFAAGMSGGIAYVLDDDQLFDTRCNLEMVDIEPVSAQDDITRLKECIEEHHRCTQSEQASKILGHWEESLPSFVKVIPVEYRKALEKMQAEGVDIWEK